MLFVYYGADNASLKKDLDAYITEQRAAHPDATFVRLDEHSFSAAALDEVIRAQGLFTTTILAVCDFLSEDKEAWEALTERLPDMHASSHIFIIREHELGKQTLNVLTPYARAVYHYPEEKAETTPSAYKPFALTDALGARNKKKLWVLLHDAFLRGASPEEVHGMLFWQIKNMLLVKDTEHASASTLGMKPFVFKKASQFAQKYSREELHALSRDMVADYHRARRGETDLSIALERRILSIK